MKCQVCGCTDTHACLGGCYWIAEELCSNCGVVISKPLMEELIDKLHQDGMNSKKVVADVLQDILNEY